MRVSGAIADSATHLHVGLLRTEVRSEVADLRKAMDRRFDWLIGLVLTVSIAFAGAVWSLLQNVR